MPGSETNFGAASWRRGGSRRGGTKRRREARTRLSAGARPVRDRYSAWPRIRRSCPRSNFRGLACFLEARDVIRDVAHAVI